MGKTNLFKAKSPSNKAKVKAINEMAKEINFLRHALIHVIKESGSNLMKNRWTIISPIDLKEDAVSEHDHLEVEQKDGNIWFTVETRKPKEEVPLIVAPPSVTLK